MTAPFTLKTERLTLRPPAVADIPAAVEFYVSERAQYAGGHVPRFRAFTNAASLLGHWDIRGYGLWAVTKTGNDTALGFVGPYNPDGWPEPEIGYVLFEGAEGRGIATEAARAALEDARTRLGWTNVVSYIAPQNAASINVATKLGAVRDDTAVVPKPEDPCLVYRHPEAGARV